MAVRDAGDGGGGRKGGGSKERFLKSETTISPNQAICQPSRPNLSLGLVSTFQLAEISAALRKRFRLKCEQPEKKCLNTFLGDKSERTVPVLLSSNAHVFGYAITQKLPKTRRGIKIG